MDLHKPVLVSEVTDAMHIKNQAWYIDATLGAGGHTIEILKHGGNVLGIEADAEMLEIARTRIEEACPVPDISQTRFKLVHDNFIRLKQIAQENNVVPQGILFDLGISTMHYSFIKRGFSFADPNQSLDMRLDPNVQKVTAADLVNALRRDQLQELFLDAMDYRDAHFFAKLIEEARHKKRIETVGDLLNVLPSKRVGKTHPATQVFMALRMGVNTELENIELGISQALEILEPGGVLAVITFHSTEDRLVKRLLENYNQKLLLPTPQEVEENPSSRSAKLRIALNR